MGKLVITHSHVKMNFPQGNSLRANKTKTSERIAINSSPLRNYTCFCLESCASGKLCKV